ncbi:uncharacterized protein YlxW (UPF0749 family) [Friedmanniella endophytica]|uniref:Uncharacterized protein YlxW (UPF0749 family) n=1 Tax=Microlunatus kandeliicorticis TaxID=1759536 RepID=A0A7W3IR95_9ACTN|nr:DUF881 domain-containing protein [Microlunatus kandeliicorticis]MBA8793796.1 uncharacterized protein YlxW (UPF0749 family) [Microlunatus kandeliicorticis]
MTEPSSDVPGLLGRLRRRFIRARVRQRVRNPRSRGGKALTGLVCLVAGLLITVSAVAARGIDLRPGRNTDLIGLVETQSRRNAQQAREVTQLRAEVDALSAQQNASVDTALLTERARDAGVEPVTGPALTVTLDDAPSDEAATGIDQDLLVVHQEDIQSIVNLLWLGGAEAMTIQGQRVISTTGVKCVGNVVVLHGIPYAPPYVISAIGDQRRMATTLATSQFVAIYKEYVDRYRLGYSEKLEAKASFPAYQGSLELSYASVPGSDASAEPTSSPTG